jgi:hypothetical protein
LVAENRNLALMDNMNVREHKLRRQS